MAGIEIPAGRGCVLCVVGGLPVAWPGLLLLPSFVLRTWKAGRRDEPAKPPPQCAAAEGRERRRVRGSASASTGTHNTGGGWPAYCARYQSSCSASTTAHGSRLLAPSGQGRRCACSGTTPACLAPRAPLARRVAADRARRQPRAPLPSAATASVRPSATARAPRVAHV